MDYDPYTLWPLRPSPRFWADLLGIGWRLLLPVLVVLVVAAGLDWWQTQAAAAATTAAPATPTKLSSPDFSDLAGAVGQSIAVMVCLFFCLLSFGVLVVLQALLSPLPLHRRYLSGRPWVYALAGAAAFSPWVYMFRHAFGLFDSGHTWGLLAGGVLGLVSPGVVEWVSRPKLAWHPD